MGTGNNFKKLIINFFSIISILLILLSIGVFIWNFHKHEISNDIQDWSALGAYFDGTIGTIIAFTNLIILTYITMIISKNSTDENKKLFFLQKKVEAYDQLAEYFYNMLLSIESSTTTLKESQLKLNQLQKDSNSSINDAMKLQKNTLKEVFSEQLFFQRYYSFLSNFHIRYGHIFNFDFDSKVFKKVLDTSNKLAQIASNPVDSFEKNQEKITMTLEAFNKHRIPLQDTLNLLTDEIQEDKK